MKHITIIATMILIMSGCVTQQPVPVTNSFDTQGRLVQSTTNLTGDQYINSRIVTAKGECQKAYYGVTDKAKDSRDIALIQMAQGLTMAAGVDPCPNPATSNDVDIAKSNNRHSSLQMFLGKLPIIGGIIGGTIVGRKAVQNRDPVIVEQPQPLVVDPVIVNPEVIEVPVPSGD